MEVKQEQLMAKFRVGSHLYGLNTPESDEDFLGIFFPNPDQLLGLKKVKEVDNSSKSSNEKRRNTSEDVDEKLYSLPHYLHLLLQNNPNIVELLFATEDNTLYTTGIWQELVDNRDKLISQKIFYTFTGYAFSQKKKLMFKRERFDSLIQSADVLESKFSKDELQDRKRLLTEEESTFLNQSLKFYKNRDGNMERIHKGLNLAMIYDKVISERDNYGWRVRTDSFEKLGYDLKFAYHIIRILAEGIELLKTGRLEYPILGVARKDILRIRNGEVSYEDLLAMFEGYNIVAQAVNETTKLPKKPDFNWANDWLVKTLKEWIIKT